MSGLHRIHTGLGPLQVAFDGEGALLYLGFAGHEFREGLMGKIARLRPVETPPPEAVNRLVAQLEAYAARQRRTFDVPLRLHGTPFEQRVWAALRRIPFGETRSYGQLAADFGDPNLSRAVGRANGANPISILVPCHRVIGADGGLTGYAGGLTVKERLLRLEARSGLDRPQGASSLDGPQGATLQGHARLARGGKRTLEHGESAVHVHLAAAEEIHGREAVLGPGVDGQVAFGDDHGAAHAVGAEVVEAVRDDGGAGGFSRLQHGGSDQRQIRQGRGIAAGEFREQVAAQGGHGRLVSRATHSTWLVRGKRSSTAS